MNSTISAADPLDIFVEAACVPIGPGGYSHSLGNLDAAAAILEAHPSLAAGNLIVAAILGDDTAVARLLLENPRQALVKGGPRNWDVLTYLCFSRYLRLDRSRSEGFVRAAEALLKAGADPLTGFYEMEHQPHPEWESILYGAAGVAYHPGLTRLLLEYGADPNDIEVAYHSPETYDNEALKLLIDSGKLSADTLSIMLLRKTDLHDRAGLQLLLEAGADPNRMTQWRCTALHQAVKRDNDLGNIELLLDYGADPGIKSGSDGRSSVSIAVRRGRADVLKACQKRGIALQWEGAEQLIFACAMNETDIIRQMATKEPGWVDALMAEGGTLLAEFAGTGNKEGVAQLHRLGIPVTSLYHGDPYFGTPKNSTALHVAAWRARHDLVQLLIDLGAPVDTIDGNGETPLILAVRACVDSYWTHRRQPTSVYSLLQAGAQVSHINLPCGYKEVDILLSRFSG